MSKFYLTKIVAFIMLLTLLAGFVFFRKDKNESESPVKQLPNQQEEQKEEKNKELTEEDRLKTFAETFAGIFYSYTWGNFSNVESQYGYMTDEMKNRERNKVEQMKKGIEDQPRKYFMVRAEVINSEMIDYQENKKAVLNIKLKVKEIDGAFVIDTEVPEIRPNTSALVDGNKNVYTGDIKDLVVKTTDKNIKINLIKIDDKWKVDEIGEIELRIKN